MFAFSVENFLKRGTYYFSKLVFKNTVTNKTEEVHPLLEFTQPQVVISVPILVHHTYIRVCKALRTLPSTQ